MAAAVAGVCCVGFRTSALSHSKLPKRLTAKSAENPNILPATLFIWGASMLFLLLRNGYGMCPCVGGWGGGEEEAAGVARTNQMGSEG